MRPKLLVLCLLWLSTLDSSLSAQCPGGFCPKSPARPQQQYSMPVVRPSSSGAQPSTLNSQQELSPVVLIRVADGKQSWSVGSGTIIERATNSSGEKVALVLTCWHLCRDREGNGAIEVRLGDGQLFLARLEKTDAMDDLALISILDPGPAPAAMPLADEPAELGAVVEARGYAHGVQLVSSPGKVAEWVAPKGTANAEPQQWLGTTCRSLNGCSGGPIVFRGRVVGVICGMPASPGTTGPHLPRIKAFLHRKSPGRQIPRSPNPQVPRSPAAAAAVGAVGTGPAIVPFAPRAAAADFPLAPTLDSQLIDGHMALSAELASLRRRVEELEQRPAGCPAAAIGDPLVSEGAAEIARQQRIQAYIDARLAELPPLTIRTLNAKGEVHQSVEARLGGAVSLQPVLVPEKGK